MQTPWGKSQHHSKIANGIDEYDTPSHGGIRLDPQRVAQFRLSLPTFAPFAGWPWFEEDCDVCAVVVVFWPLFEPNQVFGAIRQVRSMAERDYSADWAAVVKFIESTPALLRIEEQEGARHANA